MRLENDTKRPADNQIPNWIKAECRKEFELARTAFRRSKDYPHLMRSYARGIEDTVAARLTERATGRKVPRPTAPDWAHAGVYDGAAACARAFLKGY